MHGYKRIIGILLCVALIFPCAAHYVSAGDYNTSLEINVPDSHTISVEISGNGSIYVSDSEYNDGSSISARRFDQVSYSIIPKNGYELNKLIYGGEDVTSQISGFLYTAPELTSDTSIRAVFDKMDTECKILPEPNNNGYHTGDVMIMPPEGYSICYGKNDEWLPSVVITESVSDAVVALKSPTGGIVDGVSLGSINIDRTAPVVSGDSAGITIENNAWKEFFNTISFGLFFNESKTATISADDPESGIESYSYYVSDKALTMEQVKDISSWNEGNSFSLSGEDAEQKIIYARITNKAGLSLFISSDGMVFDTVAPVISGAAEGSVLYSNDPIEIKVTDAELDSVALNGVAAELKDNQAILTVYPSNDDEQVYKISAKDKAGNVKEISFSVLESWRQDGLSGSGSYILMPNKKYKMGKGKWTVEGDSTIYNGDKDFYVKEKKQYKITKSE
jgi:hypothetical protein